VEPRVSLALRHRRHQPIPWPELAEASGLSRKRLAAAVEDLARRGFVIESHPHLGLMLVDVPPSLDAAEIACDLRAGHVGRRIESVEEAASTNDLAWQAAACGRGESDGAAFFAEHQSAGRGRRGSRWLAPPHTSILCSVVLWVPGVAEGAASLTRVATVAAAAAIEDQCDLAVGTKWPNDIVIDERKVGGILVEARRGSAEATPVVIGVGLNCSQRPESFPPEIRDNVASLKVLGAEVDRTLLARSLLERLDEAYSRSANPAGAAAICEEAAKRCRTLGQRLVVVEGGATYVGEVADIDFDYGLVLRLPDGNLKRFPAMTTHVVAGTTGPR